MKYIDIRGIAWRVTVEGRRPRDIAFGIAMSGQKTKDVDLNLKERHGRPARFLLPDGERSNLPPLANSA
jgi:hypothetical protein